MRYLAETSPVSVEGIEDLLSPVAPWRVVNIGGGNPVGLMTFIETIEACLGKPAVMTMLPMQKGDVQSTYADSGLLKALTGYVPQTSVDEGVRHFVEWFSDYNR